MTTTVAKVAAALAFTMIKERPMKHHLSVHIISLTCSTKIIFTEYFCSKWGLGVPSLAPLNISTNYQQGKKIFDL